MRLTSSIVTSAGLVAVLALMLPLAGCGNFTNAVAGSGVITSDARDPAALEGVTRVSVEGSADVVVTVSPDAKRSIVVETDDNLHEMVRTYVENNTLIVTTNGNYSSKHGIRVTLVLSALDAASLAGSGDITATGIDTDSFNGSLAGSGDIKLAGTTQNVSLSVAGSGDINAIELAATDASISVAGSGDIHFNGTGNAKVAITGSGDVTCYGSPVKLVKNVLGSGDLIMK